MPRGVAIPELHERLFDAAERILLREGPAGLSTRAITTEAGCAKGVLHNHFADLDGFLAQFVLTRLHAALHRLATLPSQAGTATVRANLVEASGSLFGTPVLAAHAVLAFHPGLAARLRDARGHHSPSLVDMERLFSAYLDAEKEHGRVRVDCDTSAMALAIVATVHHLLMLRRTDAAEAPQVIARVIDVLLTSADTAAAPGRP